MNPVPRKVDPIDGPMRYCRRCDMWWIDDAEFFGTTPVPGRKPQTWCRACKRSRAGESKRRARGSAAAT